MNTDDVLAKLFGANNVSANTPPPTHVGWIPCVSGHLDFGLVHVGLSGSQDPNGARDKPNRTINYPSEAIPNHHKRNIILESWVDWKDQLAGDGEFRVVVVAQVFKLEALDGRALKGKIFLYQRSYISVPISAFLYQRSYEGLSQSAPQCKKILDFVKSADQQKKEINNQTEHTLEVSFLIRALSGNYSGVLTLTVSNPLLMP